MRTPALAVAAVVTAFTLAERASAAEVVDPVAGYVAGAPVRGRSVALLGRTNVVFLHFYAKASEWDRHAAALEVMATGFRRTPDQAVTLGSRTVTAGGKSVGGGFDWGSGGSKALIGAAIGAVVGAFGWLSKRKNQGQ